MEDAVELDGYLPLSYKGLKEEEYVHFPWDAFETKYMSGKHQFAFLLESVVEAQRSW